MIHDTSVISNRLIAKDVFELQLHAPELATAALPGQFVHMQTGLFGKPLLRRPISIADADPDKGTVTCIYKVIGSGTGVLSSRQQGEVINVMGPLGTGFPVDAVEQGGHVLLIGGGVGVPPMYILAKALTKTGIPCQIFLGFRSSEDVFYEDAFKALGDTWIATEDGSRGYQGFITDILTEEHASRYYACGPKPMLTKVKQQLSIPGYLSLEERMGCGVGACLACVCRTNTERGYAKVCSDGPVFDSKEVIL